MKYLKHTGEVGNTTTLLTSTRARAENGVSGDGLMTAVQPAARAGPSLRVIMAEGKFHGVKMDLDYLRQIRGKLYKPRMPTRHLNPS